MISTMRFAEMTQSRPDAILMVSDVLTTLKRRLVIDFATANRLPTICELSLRSRPRATIWPLFVWPPRGPCFSACTLVLSNPPRPDLRHVPGGAWLPRTSLG